MEDWIGDPLGIAIIALALVIILLMVWIAVISGRLKKLRKKYLATMGETGVANIEDVVISIKHKLADQENEIQRLRTALEGVEKQLPQMKSKVGALRYNAFGEQGNDLSFSVAVVNEQNDGIVLSGIHNRENMFIYAKPVDKGNSKYTLTPEEKEAIAAAK